MKSDNTLYAGAAVGLSFAAMALLFRGAPDNRFDYRRFNLLRWPMVRLLTHENVLFVVRLVFVALYLLV